MQESCLPSYSHPNILAAYAAWWRLIKAGELARRYGAAGAVLDFGSSSGELRHLLPEHWQYHFVEQSEELAGALLEFVPGAQRVEASRIGQSAYDIVFALDSLEHNDNPDELLKVLAAALRPGGTFVLSGPTENALYRLGRRIAGFDGHYHHCTIHTIETMASRHLKLVHAVRGPLGLPLFRLSVWQARQSGQAR